MLCNTFFIEKHTEVEVDEIFIAGGIYGNIFALEKLAKIAQNSLVVLNGDYHWFDVGEHFDAVEKLIKKHNFLALNGNVELGLSSDELSCNCNYPELESKETKIYAEQIYEILKNSLNAEQKEILKPRKTSLNVKIGSKNLAIIHGDEKSVNGWGFDRANLNQKRLNEINLWLKSNNFDIIASTHTCLSVACMLENGVFINNGSAGMPNFSEFRTGLVTRVAKTQNENALYRAKLDEIYIELIRLKYDNKAFVSYFDKIWKPQSPAQKSYKNRILGYGCPLSFKQISLGGFELV